MAKQAFLCKYAEIGIKGKNRYKFENALCEQIRRRLAKVDGEFTVVREQGRILWKQMEIMISRMRSMP